LYLRLGDNLVPNGLSSVAGSLHAFMAPLATASK